MLGACAGVRRDTRVNQTPSQPPEPLGRADRGRGEQPSPQAERQGAHESPVQAAAERKYELQLRLVLHETPHPLLPGRSCSEFLRRASLSVSLLVLGAKLSP